MSPHFTRLLHGHVMGGLNPPWKAVLNVAGPWDPGSTLAPSESLTNTPSSELGLASWLLPRPLGRQTRKASIPKLLPPRSTSLCQDLRKDLITATSVASFAFAMSSSDLCVGLELCFLGTRWDRRPLRVLLWGRSASLRARNPPAVLSAQRGRDN